MNLHDFKQYFSLSLFTLCLLPLLLGCQAGGTPTVTEATPSPPATATRPRPTATSVASAATPTVTAEADDGARTLVLWTVDSISSETEEEPDDYFSNSLRSFRRNNPDIEVELVLKKASGKGGILDFLRTSKEVAPSVLPDVAIMDATDLSQAHTNGLIQPFDGKLDRSIVQDLLPAARRMGTIEDNLVGVPLGLEIEHTVYNTAFFETAPLLWSDVLTANTRYLFPARGVNGLVNDLTLAQYFSVGGRLLDGEGTPTLDEAVLRSILEFYQQGVENGVIDPDIVLEAATAEALWPIYASGQAGIAQTTVRQYLTERESLGTTNVSSLPVPSDENTPTGIMHGWVIVLVTDSDNIAHQAAALQLIEWFMSTENNATWNEANQSIPTRDSAFQQRAGDDPYWVFLAEQLNTAQPQPGFVGYDQLGRIMQQAVVQVISGEATPDEATATAIDALGQ